MLERVKYEADQEKNVSAEKRKIAQQYAQVDISNRKTLWTHFGYIKYDGNPQFDIISNVLGCYQTTETETERRKRSSS